MSLGLGKLTNEYAQTVDNFHASKAVWMALAVSLAIRLNDEMVAAAPDFLYQEWQYLYDNGIVPQKPRRKGAE